MLHGSKIILFDEQSCMDVDAELLFAEYLSFCVKGRFLLVPAFPFASRELIIPLVVLSSSTCQISLDTSPSCRLF
jgi:hypothetical protein